MNFGRFRFQTGSIDRLKRRLPYDLDCGCGRGTRSVRKPISTSRAHVALTIIFEIGMDRHLRLQKDLP
jgi:hypothetical protein